MAAPRTNWCAICRGDPEPGEELVKCKTCSKKYHVECVGLTALPCNKAWACPGCAGKTTSSELKARVKAVRSAHAAIKARQVTFYRREGPALTPFISADKLAELQTGEVPEFETLTIGAEEDYVKAALRPYQVDGVNWILKQCALANRSCALHLPAVPPPRPPRPPLLRPSRAEEPSGDGSVARFPTGMASALAASSATRWASARLCRL